MATKPKSDFAKNSDLGKRMMNQSMVVLGIVGVIIYFVYFGELAPEEPIALTAEITQGVSQGAESPIPLTLDIKLANHTKEGTALTVPTPCDTFNWFLTGPDNEFVQSKRTEGECPQQTVSTWLDAQKAMTETFALDLDPKRVHPGEYNLYIRYWGHEKIQRITIE